MTRFVLVAPLELLEVGDGFSVSAWPLHVTVVGNFSTDLPLDTVAELVDSGTPAGDVEVGPDDLFGPRHNVRVSVVLHSDWLAALHAELVARVAATGAMFDNPEYTGAGYRPHVTATKHARVHEGDILHLSQLALVDMAPMGDGRQRRVVRAGSLA